MINLQSPSKRCFATELKSFDLDILIKHNEDIDRYIDYGVYPNWMIVKEGKSIFNIRYWDTHEIARYKRLLNMELLDRCKRFELYPKLKFYF